MPVSSLPARAPRASASRALLQAAFATTALAAGVAGCRAAASESAPTAATSRAAAGRPAAGTTTAAVPNATTPGPDSAALRTAADRGRMDGTGNSTVWLIMVSDFQCPYCKMWHDESYAALRREYVATGKARAAYLNFPLDQHEQAMPAAEAAMCASAQRHFWEYQSALFRTQEQWAKPGDMSPVFDSLATSVGADLPQFRACTRSHVMRALIEADRDRMEHAGVRSTPTFFVANQQIDGAQPTDVFRRALDAAVANPPAVPRGK